MNSARARNSSNSIFTFYTKAEYDAELAAQIDRTKRGDRVAVATMFFKADEQPIRRVLDALCAAARRGVSVDFMVDVLSDGAELWPVGFARLIPQRAPLPKAFRPQLEALERLKQHGGRYTIINQPRESFTNPFLGHSHIKFSVINNHVFVGGCNLTTIEPLDIMTSWEDSQIADWLCAFSYNLSKSGSVLKAMEGKDATLPVSSTTTLLVDAGKASQSLILDKALALIDAARDYILITCQFFPHGKTGRHLARAEARGVKVKIIYNHPSKHGFPVSWGQRGVLWKERQSKPRHLFGQQLPKDHDFLHAKLLVTEEGTMLGSHNYVHTSVRLGTAEIALLSFDQHFRKGAVLTLESQLRLGG
ncbi:MAG TPA: phospholipase D-like domain-containing protein [Patescibacteria group bacterium]|nr:phospholipase D-like domain-containing protein [Patescibacteria group bacterium]